ncbi:uncharacterized protein TRIADDRAFT_62776 [Trichoplax adhaerens]|uniref:CARD domain-containing protein n=1 Tax=Trichoplax adhaerens TaxID=10228 RepID=B3SEU6_TRIAD|nr:hypothetical protein TRIADDRAFT_62776 [Trichoplax adhaerens]EDV18749.1 hypothetical protein TRIADDRAFT_62776 [Trichoplax adhaerens]|eukprot:XP_002118765.1 hypothetical protein TRIADDRAFT_62776 [Trichoplax adhaerens]
MSFSSHFYNGLRICCTQNEHMQYSYRRSKGTGSELKVLPGKKKIRASKLFKNIGIRIVEVNTVKYYKLQGKSDICKYGFRQRPLLEDSSDIENSYEVLKSSAIDKNSEYQTQLCKVETVEDLKHKAQSILKDVQNLNDDVMKPVQANIEKILKTFNSASDFNNSIDKIKALTKLIKEIAEKNNSLSDCFAELCDKVKRLLESIDNRTERIEGTTERIDDRTERIDGRTERIEDTTERIDDRTDRIDGTTERTDNRTERIEGATERIEQKLDELKNQNKESDEKQSSKPIAEATSQENRISFSSSNKQVKSTLPDDITPKQIEPVNTVDASSNNGEDIPMSLTEEERASTIPKYKISRIGMLEIHKHILRSHYVEIIEECKSSVKPICNHLYSREILTHYLKEFIVCQPTDYEKMGKLLDILPECGNRAYGVFCEVLSTINSPVIGILENAERENEEESKGNYNVKDADNLTSQNQATSSRTKASKSNI